MPEKRLFAWWQFNGDNRSFCNQACPYCYGKKMRDFKHYWNGKIVEWEKAFARLNRDIYFVFSYGEALASHGFYECVEMIGKHPNWTLNIISNLALSPQRLLQSQLAKDGRLFIQACWHPLGVPDRLKGWENFKKHLLMLKTANILTQVSMVWYEPQMKWFPEYFEWLDQNDFRVNVRRFVYDSLWARIPFVRSRWKRIAGKARLENYSKAERGFLYASTCPKVTAYGLDLESPRGKLCNAGKDMMLVDWKGNVSLCASCCGSAYDLGNIFKVDFKLKTDPVRCPTNVCGGDFGMFVLPDDRFKMPELANDTFISIEEEIPQSSPVAYPKRAEMLFWLEELKREQQF